MGFTFFGQTVPRLTLFVGGILCAVGIGFYLGTGTSSITALIPTFVGIPLTALGVLAERSWNAGPCSCTSPSASASSQHLAG